VPTTPSGTAGRQPREQRTQRMPGVLDEAVHRHLRVHRRPSWWAERCWLSEGPSRPMPFTMPTNAIGASAAGWVGRARRLRQRRARHRGSDFARPAAARGPVPAALPARPAPTAAHLGHREVGARGWVPRAPCRWSRAGLVAMRSRRAGAVIPAASNTCHGGVASAGCGRREGRQWFGETRAARRIARAARSATGRSALELRFSSSALSRREMGQPAWSPRRPPRERRRAGHLRGDGDADVTGLPSRAGPHDAFTLIFSGVKPAAQRAGSAIA
jgi:hypothetical protein